MTEHARELTPRQWGASTLPRLLRRSAEHFGEATFLEDEGCVFSFRRMAQAAEQAARAFIACGVEPGSRVAVWAPNIGEWVVAAIGLQQAGAILTALNFRYQAGEAAEVLERVSACMLCTLGESETGNPAAAVLRERVPSLRHTVCLRGEAEGALAFSDFLAMGEEVDPQQAREREDAVGPEDIADLVFTSGTTGKPKAVMSTHGQNLRTFDAWSRGVGLKRGDRSLIIPPFSHSFGSKAGWLACLMRGATILPERGFDVPALLKRIQDDRVSVWPGAPSMYQAVLAHPRRGDFDLSSLRLAVTGAAVVPVELVRRMRSELGFETVITAYGLSESTGCVSMCSPDDDPETIATTSGRAFPDVEIACVDNAGGRVPTGEPGEILVRGYNVMKGYWGDPEQSAEAVDAEGWLHTGDVGVLDERGYLRITDRIKDMYIMNGFNVYPAEVENRIFEHEAVAQVAVIGVPNDKTGESGMAFVVPTPGAAPEPEALIAWCKEQMADYKAPRALVLVEELPLNATGKVDKLALREIARTQHAG